MYANYINSTHNYDLSLLDSGIIQKKYNRMQTVGVSFSSSLGPIAIVEELAFNLTEDFNGKDKGIKNSDITLNSQFTGTLFGGPMAQLNMVYQYVINYKKSGSDLEKAIYDVHLQPTDHILFFIGHMRQTFLREKLYLAINMGFFFSTDVYIAPRINYAISDNLSLESGADIYTGEYKNKALERYLGGDNFFFRIKYEI
jgi:hypothetical protein